MSNRIEKPIVYISPYYDPKDFSGGNRRFNELGVRFQEEFGDNFTLVVTKGMTPPWWKGKNLIEVDYEFNHVSKFKAARQIGKYLDSLPPSIVILESVPIPYKSLRRHTHFQVAYDFRYFTGDSKSLLYRLTFSSYLKSQWSRAEYMVTCSDFSIAELEKYVGYDRNKVIKSFFGLRPELFDILKQPAPEKTVDLIYVGHFERRKNQKPLIKAISLVNKDMVVRFVGGDTGMQQELEQYAKSLGLTNTTFGRIATDDELWNLYRQSRVSAFPSIYEGFGMPLVEGLALGIPTICSDIPVFHEVGGVLPTFFDPHNPEDIAEKLKDALENPRIPNADEVRKQTEQFFWENIYHKFIEDLADLSAQKATT